MRLKEQRKVPGKKLKRSRFTRKKLAEFMDEAMDDKSSPLWMTTFADMAILPLDVFHPLLFIILHCEQQVQGGHSGNRILPSIGLLELLDSVEVKKKRNDRSADRG